MLEAPFSAGRYSVILARTSNVWGWSYHDCCDFINWNIQGLEITQWATIWCANMEKHSAEKGTRLLCGRGRHALGVCRRIYTPALRAFSDQWSPVKSNPAHCRTSVFLFFLAVTIKYFLPSLTDVQFFLDSFRRNDRWFYAVTYF